MLSMQMGGILSGMQDRRNALAGIDILRKICNHPDLLQRAQWEGSDDYGNPKRSGKLLVALKVSMCNVAADCELPMHGLSSVAAAASLNA